MQFLGCRGNEAVRRIFFSPWLPIVLTALLAAIYAGVINAATPWGAWGYSDSAAYIGAARSLAQGHGLSLPGPDGADRPALLTPPFYSAMLALGVGLGLDALDSARLLAVLLAFLFPAGFALLGAQAAGKPWLGPWLAGMVLIFPPLLDNAASAMSEQLFLTLGFAGLLVLLLPRPSTRGWFLSAGLVGLAALTRYLGAAFILAGALLLWLRLPPGRRWVWVALYGLGAGLPLAAWFGYTLSVSRTLGARSLVVAGGRWENLMAETAEILSSWLPYSARGPEWFPALLKLGLLLLAGLILAAWSWRESGRESRSVLLAGLCFAAAYLAALSVSSLLASLPPDLIPRMYSPLWPAGCLILAGVLRMVAEKARGWFPYAGKGIAVILAIVLALCGVYYMPQLSERVERGRLEGVGYTARIYRGSPVFAHIRSELAGRPLISDEPALVLLYTGRGAYGWDEWIPGSLAAAAGGPPPGDGATRLDDLMRGGAALVIFPYRVEEEFGPESRALLEAWTGDLSQVYSSPEAWILRSP